MSRKSKKSKTFILTPDGKLTPIESSAPSQQIAQPPIQYNMPQPMMQSTPSSYGMCQQPFYQPPMYHQQYGMYPQQMMGYPMTVTIEKEKKEKKPKLAPNAPKPVSGIEKYRRLQIQASNLGVPIGDQSTGKAYNTKELEQRIKALQESASKTETPPKVETVSDAPTQ
jgi:hypothetical protein